MWFLLIKRNRIDGSGVTIRNAVFHNTALNSFLLSFAVVKFDFKLS